MNEVLVQHEKVRIVKTFGTYRVEEKNWEGKWVKVWGCGEWFSFDSNVLDEFKYVVLRNVR